MHVTDEANRLVKNNVLTMLARFGGIIAGPMLVAAFGIFGWYVSQIDDAIASATATARAATEAAQTAALSAAQSVEAVNTSAENVANRVSVIETRINIGQKNRDAQYDTIIASLADVQKTLVLILQTQAAQNEKFNALEKRVDRSGN